VNREREVLRALTLVKEARRVVERLERGLFSMQAQEACQARLRLREAHKNLATLASLLGAKEGAA
jgi:hypothetical protein